MERYRKELNLQAIELEDRDLLEELRDLSVLVNKAKLSIDVDFIVAELRKQNCKDFEGLSANNLNWIQCLRNTLNFKN
jgi:hypothetical protein